MNHEYFECRKCSRTELVSSIGKVVVGPRCKNCNKEMKPLHITQLQLDFDGNKSKRKRHKITK